MDRRTRPVSPWAAVLVLSVPGVALTYLVTGAQVDSDRNCTGTAPPASCGVTPRSAATVVAVGTIVAAVLALAAQRGTRSRVLAWAVFLIWVLGVAVYVALPPSG